MDSETARMRLDAIRRKLDAELDKCKTHFGMHMLYINAFDELESLARSIAILLPEQSNG